MHLWGVLEESPLSDLYQEWGWLTVPSTKSPNPVTGSLFQMHILSTAHVPSTCSGKYREEVNLARGKCSLEFLFS